VCLISAFRLSGPRWLSSVDHCCPELVRRQTPEPWVSGARFTAAPGLHASHRSPPHSCLPCSAGVWGNWLIVMVPASSDQAPGRSCRHLAHEHGGADHEQHPRSTGNPVQRDLLGAQHLVVGVLGCGVGRS